MTIKTLIEHSSEFKKLCEFVNTPQNSYKADICTAYETTFDVRKIILELLSQSCKNSFIYSLIYSRNIKSFAESTIVQINFTYSNFVHLLEIKRFKRNQKVTAKGEFACRGDTISLWPSCYDHPIRISFWGEEIEQIEIYDDVYQNVLEKINYIVLGDESLLVDEIEKQSLHIFKFDKPFTSKFIIFSDDKSIFSDTAIDFAFTYPPLFFHRLDLLQKVIRTRLTDNWTVKISTSHSSDMPISLKSLVTQEEFTSGFENSKLKLALYTDREIYGTIFISAEKAKNKKASNKYLAELEGEIAIDNYIVHEDYGIGIYRGIVQKEVLGKTQNYLLIEYALGDKLSLPLAQVYKLTKYIGPTSRPPTITRLGKANWELIKRRIKKKILLVARDLIRLYAETELASGFKLEASEIEEQFASEFEFTETDDQKRVIKEILLDMESNKCMNRLLVGDVGFGKTEVAIRAAFRAVINGKQVAVLCPTTILCAQHLAVFKHRMRNFPISIEPLSRFSSKTQNKKTIEGINNGSIDIVIGTHRLLSNDVKFKELGLLVIDEEQRFGVMQKEKIRKLSYGMHVLSMSATPIPRTLSMALSNLRDISLITTPPPGRKAIETYLELASFNRICHAILHEVQRGGQIYFIHNEVRTIESIKKRLEAMLPNVRFCVGHGQMHPQTLGKVMREFYEHRYDCLVATTIIENGIDLPNVNTIIINKAEKFGLSELYQLRGRVGRSDRQAYCYLFYTQENILLDENAIPQVYTKRKKIIPFKKAKERLQAIFEAQDLGSGFKIASKDLEIRGAGNLLGKEQHGNIAAIGLGLYTELLGEEIEKIKKARVNLKI